jgi:hypothetical protein
MKKMMYENVNEIRRNGCFTNSGFKTFENMMIGRVACSNRDRNGGEVTRFFDVVMFRDKTTGEFPFKDLFQGGKKVVFAGRFNTREVNGRQYDEIIISEMHENIPREVEVPDKPAQPKAKATAQTKDEAAPADEAAPYRGMTGDQFLEDGDLPEADSAPLPQGFDDDQEF